METSSYCKILTISLMRILIMITCPKHKAIIVSVFCTKTPAKFLHFLLETARSISKALEDTGNGADGIIILL